MLERNQDTLAKLTVGYKKFREGFFSQNTEIFKNLATQGQKPKIMFISCSDSRVNTTTIMSCEPAEIFKVKNVANLVPSYFDKLKNMEIGAALEFAVRHLQVQHIIVMGHSGCGGIKALLESDTAEPGVKPPTTESGFIKNWVQIAKEARDKTLNKSKDLSSDERAKFCEEQALLVSMRNLETYPWIQLKIKAGELFLHAWRFDIGHGLIQCYNPNSKIFEELKSTDLGQNEDSARAPHHQLRSKL